MSGLIVDNPRDWILRTLFDADKPDYETFRVYTCLSRYISQNREFIGVLENVTPQIIRIKPLTDLADDCFFSVTFFSGYIQKRATRRGAPDVIFYKNTGKNAYSSIGYPTIAKNWDFWSNYINEHIVLD